MARTLRLYDVRIAHDANNDGEKVYAEFSHCDSVKTSDSRQETIDVTAQLSFADGYHAAGGMRDDAKQACKDFVNNAGPFAGGTYALGDYDAEGWTN